MFWRVHPPCFFFHLGLESCSLKKSLYLFFIYLGIFYRISIFKAPQALINILMFAFEDFRELSLNGTLGSTGPFRP